jgi:hypothetical protein
MEVSNKKFCPSMPWFNHSIKSLTVSVSALVAQGRQHNRTNLCNWLSNLHLLRGILKKSSLLSARSLGTTLYTETEGASVNKPGLLQDG